MGRFVEKYYAFVIGSRLVPIAVRPGSLCLASLRVFSCDFGIRLPSIGAVSLQQWVVLD
jgi:hypothetical protein